MTVSPRWPQDGSRSSDADDHAAAEAGKLPNMPPTLLELPDLNPAPMAGKPVSKTANDAGSVEQTAPGNDSAAQQPSDQDQTQPVAPVTPVEISPAAADAAAKEVQINSDVDQSRDSGQSFSGRPLPPVDMPAGRSWMEATRQHGIVVLLLLAVVATAIYTGRNTEVDPTDEAIADIELGEIDEGIAASIPLPAHEHEIDSGMVSSEPVTNPDSNDYGSVLPPQEQVATSPQPATSIASLEPPQPTGQADSSDVANPEEISLEAALVASDNTSTQVDATAVGNRIDSTAEVDSDVAFNPPSLESLAESLDDQETELSSNQPGIPTNTFVPVPSRTPNGISDWLQFLPASPNANSN